MSQSAAPSGYVRTLDLLGALSLAADLALGLPAGHGVRATYIGMRIAAELGLPAGRRADLFYAGLLIDVGCTAWTTQIAALVGGDEIAARRELFFNSDARDPRDVRARMAELPSGAVLEVRSDDLAAPESLAAWCRLTGHELVSAAGGAF